MRPLSALADLAFVPVCPACDERMTAGEPLCARCLESLYELDLACARCAEPLADLHRRLCPRCVLFPPPFAKATSPYRYGGELAVALRRLKLEGRPDIGRTLAPLFSRPLAAAAAPADVLVPIPLSWRRMAARTFNPSEVLLAHAARAARRPRKPALLWRHQHTEPQAGKGLKARETNVRGAFSVPGRARRRVAGRRILLVDDIMTTGATLAAAARALLAAGCAEVHCFAFARAEGA